MFMNMGVVMGAYIIYLRMFYPLVGKALEAVIGILINTGRNHAKISLLQMFYATKKCLVCHYISLLLLHF